MSYLIAVATSDEVNIDLSFGEAPGFVIYEADGAEYHKKEYREAPEDTVNESAGTGGCGDGEGCGNGTGCASGVHARALPKVALIKDCRGLVCRKIGRQAEKQFQLLQISAITADCGVEEALTKFTAYFERIDAHRALRNRDAGN